MIDCIKQTVLLSDNLISRSLLNGYKIISAHFGFEVLEKAETDNPDLILLNIAFPDMSGFDVITALKESDSTNSIPIVIIAELSGAANEVKWFSLGAMDYISKPFDKSIVRARIKAHLQTSRLIKTAQSLGFVDALTNIPNRRKFDYQMITTWGHSIQDKAPVSVIMIDIDYFKMFNDTYGHQQGDVALQAVANVIKSSLKRESDFAARWGGEEFVVLLPDTENNGAMEVAEGIRKSVESSLIPSIVGTSYLKVTVSIGIVTTIPDIESLMVDTIRQADIALYNAKRSGKNRICVYEYGDVDLH